MKTKKLVSLVLAVLMLLSAAPFVYAANLPVAQNVKAIPEDGAITIKWDPINDFNARKDLASFRILYSTDTANWSLATSAPRDSDTTKVFKPDEGSFMPGTMYFFAVQSVSWNNELGQISSPSIPVLYTDSVGDLDKEFEQVKMAMDVFKPKQIYSNSDQVQLKKGLKIVWDSSLYTLTFQVTARKGSKATVKTTLENKVGSEQLFYVSYIASAIKAAGQSVDDSVIEKNGVATRTFNLEALKEGPTSINIQVSCAGGLQYQNCKGYRNYMDDMLYFKQMHSVNFQNAPSTPSIDFRGSGLKVTDSAISFGKAYSSKASGVKSSGTILYYKTAAAKKWSQKVFAAGKTLKLTKLKANTEYQLRTADFIKSVSAANKKTQVTVKSSLSNTLKIRTGIATAPAIQSVKVSNVKLQKGHQNGYWKDVGSRYEWVEPYDYYYTTYTLTVTLKSVPKGMQALQLKGGHSDVAVGAKKTYTFQGNIDGNAKGKRLSIDFNTFTNVLGKGWYVGSSPSVTKTVTL